MIRIAIFASGRGSNAVKIYEHGVSTRAFETALIISNRSKAGVLEYAHTKGIPNLVIDRNTFYQSEEVLSVLRKHNIDLIVLAGFLWLVPGYLIYAFPYQIINIHPALLPAYGGKGMYGHHIHEEIEKAREKESGITIHYVNVHYDEGAFILQTKCVIDGLPATEIAARVLRLEHHFYPRVIEGLANHLSAAG